MSQSLVNPNSLSGPSSCVPALLLCLMLCSTGVAAREARVAITLQAAALPQSLIELARQADLSLVFATASVPLTPRPAMTGIIEPREALRRLLQGTGLVAEFLGERVVSIGPECADAVSCTATPATDTGIERMDTREIEQTIVRARLLTGSHISQANHLGTAPVDIIGAPEIEASGAQSLGDLLRFMPAVIGNQTSTAISNGGDGTASITLRGLPASNTLVLVNGRRSSNDGIGTDAFDLNTLSPSAVERIEILKDGASTAYGSDAIAGVVNIILKRDFDGLQLSTQYGQAERGDGETRTTNLLWGDHWSRGSVLFSASVFDQSRIWARDRKVSRNADGRSRGGADLRSSATPAARIALDRGAVILRNPGGEYLSGTEAADFRPIESNDLFNFPDYSSTRVPSQRTNLYGSLQFDLHERLTAFAELGYSDNESDATLAPTPVFTAFEALPLTVAADNVYNPFGVEFEDVRKRFLELGPRRQDDSSETARLALGLQGSGQDGWEWDASYTWSRAEAEQSMDGLIDGDRLQQALGPAAGCDPAQACIPVNLFGAPGALDQPQREFLLASTHVDGYAELQGIEANLSGPLLRLRAGELMVATGSSYRRESIGSKGAAANPRVAIGGSDVVASSGDREVQELWGEMLLPLFAAAPHRHHLDLDLAARYSHYSDFGGSTNGKIALRYRPVTSLMVRSSWSQGFRAPSLLDLHARTSQTQAFLSDPCAMPANVGVLPGCPQPGDPSRNQFLTIIGGNSRLDAETSQNRMLGVVWTPEIVGGLMLSVDAFRIDLNDVVDASAQYVLNQNAASGAFADRVQRDANGNLQRVVATNINVGERRVTGLDIGLHYRLPALPIGRIAFDLDTAYIHEYLNQFDPLAPRTDLAGTFMDEASEGMGAIPEWKSRLAAYWNRAWWDASYRMYLVSELQENVPNSDRHRSINPWVVHDVQIGRRFALFEGLRVGIGIDNVLDEQAPFAASAFNDNHDGRTHDLRGRYWYAKLTQDF
ncbi:MAG: TonB-dependent receptor [Gammaproteobacteria bacterium]|nr:TonB-dependent receptor [Gammaproteobacteria bacterium]